MTKRKKIAGVDEVGRGCLAGPVFSAAVILKKKVNYKMYVRNLDQKIATTVIDKKFDKVLIKKKAYKK